MELLLSWSDGGHFITLTSFHWDDADDDYIIDIGEDAWIDFIDPWTGQQGLASIWHGGDIIETDYIDGSWISMAVSESVPGRPRWPCSALPACCVAGDRAEAEPARARPGHPISSQAGGHGGPPVSFHDVPGLPEGAHR